MLNRKIISVLILCGALVLSVWLFSKNPADIRTVTDSAGNNSAIEAANPRPFIEQKSDEEWKKLLTKIDPKDEVVTDLTKKPESKNEYDDTTLTGQLARDFFSQYLLSKQGGTEITSANADRIVQTISNAPQYTAVSSPVYILSNLKITPKTDLETMRKYKRLVEYIFQVRGSEVKEDPTAILRSVANSQNERDAKRFDPLILTAQKTIHDFLNMEVPQNSANLHLAALNSISSLLTDLQAFRVIVTDPTRALAALGNYNEHLTKFNTTTKSLRVFLTKY